MADRNFWFSHLGVENGLSQSSVYNIFQDSDGYLWFGTQNGANKYDGYEFRTYKNEVNNPESLSDGYINAVNEDRNKNIWIGTNNGLNCIDYISEKITRFYPQTIDSSIVSNAVTFFIRFADGRLLAVCGNHLLICNPDKTVQTYRRLQEIDASVSMIGQDKNLDIYLSTPSNLYVYSDNGVLKKKYGSETVNFPPSTIQSMLPDSGGIWFGTFEHGVYYFDRENATFTRYDTSNTQLSNNHIRTLLSYTKDSILIGTFEGLNLMNKRDNSIVPVRSDSERFGGLSHFSVHSMLMDRDGTLWIGTYAAGISYSSPYNKAISFIASDEFSGIIGKGQEDGDGNMWFATEGGGLFCYNPHTKAQKLYPLRPLSAGNHEINIIKSILIDGDTVFCGTHLGTVYKFSISRKRYELLYRFDGFGIFTLLSDSKKRLWIPTTGNHQLSLYEQGKVDTVFYYAGNLKRFFASVSAMAEHRDNVYIFGSYTGRIYLYDRNRLTVENIHEQLPLGEQEQIGIISAIVKDDSSVYISTTKMGLFRFDNNLRFMKQYSHEDGITDSYISSVIVDKDNNLWVATGNEIFRLNRQEDRFYSVNPTGSFFQELTLRSVSISSDGTLYFPGNKGVVAFNPQHLTHNPTVPPIYITSLKSNNQDVTHRIKIIGRNVTRKTGKYAITLKSNENNLTIKYTALNYIHSNGNKYSIKMEGVDELWHQVENRREAYYSNLRPGRYTFRLRASNNDGVRNPEETTLSVFVKPPVYRTGAAYALYTLILSVTLALIIQYRHKQRTLKQEIRIKQIEQDKLNELHAERMRMYANFSHELKTPLTLIMNPLQELTQTAVFSSDVKQSLQKMKKNTDKMLSLVANLMDVQKYEAGKIILNKKPFDFSLFMEEIYHSFEPVAKSRDIKFVLINELPATSYIVCLDETEIEKVFSNLLSNAFKFTPSNGAVTIKVQSVRENGNPCLSIQVSDTGNGFSEEEAKMIFEPFYQFGKDLHQQMSGTGIGLNLVRSIVLQHNGFIKVSSQEKIGSTFTVLLPDTETQSATSAAVLPEKVQETNTLIRTTIQKNRKTVLLVENDRDTLDYLEEKLSATYVILQAENGKKALAVIRQKTPDVVISDIMMPVMDGISLCHHLKNHPNYYHIPVILLTGKSEEFQQMEGFDAGADAYLTKPFDIKYLKVLIKNLVENREKIKAVYGNTHLLKNLGIDKSQYENEFVLKYIEFVKANISNPDLGLADIYRSLGMSRANFYRKVKEVTHLSAYDLIKYIRLDAVAKLLVESDKNISEITQITGFSSRTFLSRLFKSKYGLSPSEYQKKYRKNGLDNNPL